jgi:hypothetical protein
MQVKTHIEEIILQPVTCADVRETHAQLEGWGMEECTPHRRSPREALRLAIKPIAGSLEEVRKMRRGNGWIIAPLHVRGSGLTEAHALEEGKRAVLDRAGRVRVSGMNSYEEQHVLEGYSVHRHGAGVTEVKQAVENMLVGARCVRVAPRMWTVTPGGLDLLANFAGALGLRPRDLFFKREISLTADALQFVMDSFHEKLAADCNEILADIARRGGERKLDDRWWSRHHKKLGALRERVGAMSAMLGRHLPAYTTLLSDMEHPHAAIEISAVALDLAL